MKKTLTERFDNYISNNPQVYDLFVKFTNEVVKAGKTKISAWLIINRIRWETEVVVNTDEKFKISNDFAALLSRKFMAEYPQHAALFNTKQMKRS